MSVHVHRDVVFGQASEGR